MSRARPLRSGYCRCAPDRRPEVAADPRNSPSEHPPLAHNAPKLTREYKTTNQNANAFFSTRAPPSAVILLYSKRKNEIKLNEHAALIINKCDHMQKKNNFRHIYPFLLIEIYKNYSFKHFRWKKHFLNILTEMFFIQSRVSVGNWRNSRSRSSRLDAH